MLTMPGDRCVMCGNSRIKVPDASFHVLRVEHLHLRLSFFHFKQRCSNHVTIHIKACLWSSNDGKGSWTLSVRVGYLS